MTIELKPHHNPSSNIFAYGHDPEANELHVQFRDGSQRYIYSGVSKGVHSAMQQVDSAGVFFHQKIKGKYTHRVAK